MEERPFLEQFKGAASEADIEGMNLKDALCLMLLSGIRDARLREKLSELEQPTLPAFGVLIDTYQHSKTASGPSAAANRSEGRNQQQNKNKNAGGQKIMETEKKRRAESGFFCHFLKNLEIFKKQRVSALEIASIVN